MNTEMTGGDSGQPGAKPDVLVGLGASAGGVAALQQFFTAVRPDSGAAFVVILHMSPEHESRLSEVLQNTTQLPVVRVTEATPLLRDRVYVISPNTSLRVADGILAVTDVLRPEERRAPVDIFFRTLAEMYGRASVAVVLSGTGPNGSSGIRRVKECGGLVIAQDPEEAVHADMPRNSIATGLVDYVLRVADMPSRIEAYQVSREHLPASAAAAAPLESEASSVRDILAVLRARTGHDFSNYKQGTILRRIQRRQAVNELPDISAYAVYLRQHPQELSRLLNEMLISVTQFFRDVEVFNALEQNAVPRIFRDKRLHDQVRVWVAGSSTGEEAYSVAMLLCEYAVGLASPPAIQVFATDLDEEAIARAREGYYTEAAAADVSPERLRRFFLKEPGGYRVKRELREMVLFARHNVLRDPPFSHLDLICCRNLLIYLNPFAQAAVLETFHFGLRQRGLLLLGTSETADQGQDLFAVTDKASHLYESVALRTRPLPPVPEISPLPQPPHPPLDRRSSGVPERLSAAELHLHLLEEFAPPTLVVDEEQQVIHVSPSAGRYLQVSGGEPSRDLMKMIRPELHMDLRSALYQSARDLTTVELPALRITTADGTTERVSILVRPGSAGAQHRRKLLTVVFRPAGGDFADDEAAGAATPQSVDQDAAGHMEREISRLKAQLRATVEQYEVQAEEAKASNEELQAVNEELRSAAEELETSKEELQSVNEELTTVNEELKNKIEELGVANNDFQNLINSTEIGTVFLDRSLRVKLSTPRMREVFNLLPSDVGRPLSDITGTLKYEGLAQDADEVLMRLQPIEREVESVDGRWFLVRVLPYRTTDERIEGLVLTFQDITGRRTAEQEVRAAEERLRLLIDSVKDYALITVATNGVVTSWNTGARRMFGYDDDEIIGKPLALLFTQEDRDAGVADQELARARRDGRAEDERWHVRKDGFRFYSSGVTTPLRDSSRGFVKIARDLTGPRTAADALRRSQETVELQVQERTLQLRQEIAARREAEQRVTNLVRQLVTAQEDERARVARDIHDHLGQQLTALRLLLDRHQQRCTSGEAADGDLTKASELVGKVDTEIDFLAWQLRPAALDDLGLAVALERYLTEWSSHHGVAAEFRSAGLDGRRMSSEIETMFYRIAQEALNNIGKHAHATRADVILEVRGGGVILVVEDDGVGFDPEATLASTSGMGLLSMRERAALISASLDIESAPGQGTTIYVRKSWDEGNG